MKEKAKSLTKTFFAIVVIGFFLMIFTYLLPMGRIRGRILSGKVVFPAYQTFIGYETTQLDSWTDSLILGEIAHKEPKVGILKNAMGVYGVADGVESFNAYVAGDTSKVTSYERYWHGNLVVLKPLFIFFDYETVKHLIFFFQIIMVYLIIKLMKKNTLEKYTIPFIVSIFLIHPEVMGISLQYSAMYNLLLVSLAVLLKFKDKIFEKDLLMHYFLITGMLTSFFDFLTFPAIIFGVPIVFYFLLDKEGKTFKERLKKLIIYGITWSVGYIGMWFSKWVLASIVFQTNCIKQGINTIFYRSGTTDFTRIDALVRNLSVYRFRGYITIFIMMILYYGYRLYKNRKNINKELLINCLPIAAVGLIPFVWYLVVSNHSYIHYWMTYREMIIFFFATQCVLEYLINNKDRRIESEKRSIKNR